MLPFSLAFEGESAAKQSGMRKVWNMFSGANPNSSESILLEFCFISFVCCFVLSFFVMYNTTHMIITHGHESEVFHRLAMKFPL